MIVPSGGSKWTAVLVVAVSVGGSTYLTADCQLSVSFILHSRVVGPPPSSIVGGGVVVGKEIRYRDFNSQRCETWSYFVCGTERKEIVCTCNIIYRKQLPPPPLHGSIDDDLYENRSVAWEGGVSCIYHDIMCTEGGVNACLA